MTETLQERFSAAGLDWIVPGWPAPPAIRAFSTTRNGAGGEPFDLSRRARADASVKEELARWLPEEPIWLAQTHGRGVWIADAPRAPGASAPEADAAVARGANMICAVLTADCMPVLLSDRSGSVVAAVHAGWRGLGAGVIESALDAMQCNPREVLAWLGPAIGPRAFEVGTDVFEAHCAGDAGAAACFAPLRPGKWLADLYGLARRRLARRGVTAIHGGDRCTVSEPGAFYSYRRDGSGADGRMASFIWREER
jgi:YfiH family protein